MKMIILMGLSTTRRVREKEAVKGPKFLKVMSMALNNKERPRKITTRRPLTFQRPRTQMMKTRLVNSYKKTCSI